MNADRQIKVLLALITLALLMNALNPWLLPRSALAAPVQADLPMMEVHLRNMDSHLEDVVLQVERIVENTERASLPQLQCAWTYLVDQGSPQIGADGEISLNEATWGRLSADGWMLKTAGMAAGSTTFYVFERCR